MINWYSTHYTYFHIILIDDRVFSIQHHRPIPIAFSSSQFEKRSAYGTLLNTLRTVPSAISANALKMFGRISWKMSCQFSFKNAFVLSPNALSPLYKFLKSNMILRQKRNKKIKSEFNREINQFRLPCHSECQFEIFQSQIFFAIPTCAYSIVADANVWIH